MSQKRETIAMRPSIKFLQHQAWIDSVKILAKQVGTFSVGCKGYVVKLVVILLIKCN